MSLAAIPVEGLVALVGLALIGAMLLLSKIFTKMWIYLMLLSPSWATTLYEAAVTASEQDLLTAIQSHTLELLFVLAPIDKYLVGSESLMIYGVVLLGIWLYVIVLSTTKLLKGWLLPVTPIIFWLLAQGMPNTIALLSGYLPDWLLAYSGLPLMIVVSTILGLALFLFRLRKAR